MVTADDRNSIRLHAFGWPFKGAPIRFTSPRLRRPFGAGISKTIALTSACCAVLCSAQTAVGVLPAGIGETPPILRIETGRHTGPVRRLALSEGRSLVVTASDDKTARVWDSRTGQALLILRPPIGPGDIGQLYGAAIHPTRALVAVGGTTAQAGKEGKIYLFDLDSGRLAGTIAAGVGAIKRLVWSADGSILVAGYADPGGVRAFSGDGRLLFEERTGGAVYGLAVGARGLVAATDFAGRIVLLRAAAGDATRVKSVDVQAREPWGIALSPDESLMVVGYRGELTRPDIVEVATGRVVRRLQPAGANVGNYGVVAWAPDGRTVAVGGSASATGHRFPVWFFNADDGNQRSRVDVAGNSVLDLAARRDGRFVFASFDGSWGVVGADVELQVDPALNDLRGPRNLLASGDLRKIGWSFGFGSVPATFDFTTRAIGGSNSTLKPALVRRSLLDSPLQAGFEAEGASRDRRSAIVNGATIRFGEVELASCGTYLHTSRDAILGTTKALYRIDGEGRPMWRLTTSAEVDAVVASDDDRVFLTAMGDGVIQWRRASDGAELFSLLPTRDGRWIIWTPQGYFDASPGADTLAGWVTSGPDRAAEMFSLGRFRDRYQRPDIIDRLLETLDFREAIEQAEPSTRHDLLEATATRRDRVTAEAARLQVAPPKADEFPPSLLATGTRNLKIYESRVEVPFSVDALSEGSAPQIEVRVDGRPITPSRIQLPSKFDGKAQGSVTFEVKVDHASIALLARNKAGYSDPLTFEVESQLPASTSGANNARVSSSQDSSPKPRPTVTAPSVASSSAHFGVTNKPLEPTSVVPSRASEPQVLAAVENAASKGTGRRRPTLFLLAVGISEYERPAYRLGLPAKDAIDFAHAMSAQKDHLYGQVETRVLTNSQASRQAVLGGLRWLADVVGPSDVGILFLAGHGVNEHSGQYYFLGYDAHDEDVQRTAVAERDIRDALRRIKGRAIFFVDTCFAGNVIGDPRTSSRELSRLANDLSSTENGVVVFASSSGRQESEESDSWGNGAFTKALIDGLNGGADLNHAGRITFKGLDFFVSEEVRRLTKGRQTPVTIVPIGVPDFDVAQS